MNNPEDRSAYRFSAFIGVLYIACVVFVVSMTVYHWKEVTPWMIVLTTIFVVPVVVVVYETARDLAR